MLFYLGRYTIKLLLTEISDIYISSHGPRARLIRAYYYIKYGGATRPDFWYACAAAGTLSKPITRENFSKKKTGKPSKGQILLIFLNLTHYMGKYFTFSPAVKTKISKLPIFTCDRENFSSILPIHRGYVYLALIRSCMPIDLINIYKMSTQKDSCSPKI